MSLKLVLRFAVGGMLLCATGAAQSPTTPAAKPSGAKPKPAKPKPAKPAAAQGTLPPKPALEPGLYATITTSMGPVTLRLYEKESPITVRNFTDLAAGNKEWLDPKTNQRVKRPLYDGLIFHRVIPGFMIQGGDPTGTGSGGTDPIPDEFDPSLQFDRPGRLAMANAGPQTGSCQFFITEGPTAHLNGRHTIFGQVVEGQEVVEKIARVPRSSEDRPYTPVRIVRVAVRRVGTPAKPKPGAPKAKPAAAKPPASKVKPAP